MTAPHRSPAAPDVLPGDPVDAFVAKHQRALWRFLRVLGCAGQEADAIALDAIVIALRRGVPARDGEAAAAFLRQTARHLWLRRQRSDRRRAARHAEAAERLWQQRCARDDGDAWLDALDRCLGELPERSRTALERTYRDGLGRAELGGELGIGEHGVRNLLARLRAALRDCIERRLER
ncbi:MAG: sigma-70 family RNA polymerase sigma factor [Planctomycetota bacterium]